MPLSLEDTVRTLHEYEAWREEAALNPDTSPVAYVALKRLAMYEPLIAAIEGAIEGGHAITHIIDGVRIAVTLAPEPHVEGNDHG